jgi:FkbH-like protein
MSKVNAVQQLAETRKAISAGDIGTAMADLRHLMLQGTLRPEQYSIVSDFVAELVKHAKPSDTVARIAILGSYTTQPIAIAARCALLGEGVLADVYEAPFGAYLQEILSPESGLYSFRPEAVVIAVGYAALSNRARAAMPVEAVREALDRELEYWRSLWGVLAARLGKPVLQHLFEVPEEEFLGVAERRSGWSASRFVESLNARLIEEAPDFVKWIDVDRLAARVGRHNWHEPRLYYHGKLGFSLRFVPDYSLLFAAAWRSAAGKTKKALVVDLDNTLWGGVIGDDGIKGIRLGPDSAEGEAYAAFCEYLKALTQRGVILAVCSKNDRATAAEVFAKHPHMPLRLDDFAAFQCSWEDKAYNLRLIAGQLNIDVSSFVFVDDNPAECELVRQLLPTVHVIQLNDDPASFVRRLDREHLFDSQSFSAEDLKRTKSYQARAKLATLQATAPDLDTYLTSMEMRGEVWVARQEDLSRLAQMEAKTNQFNLTTRCWTSEQVSRFMTADDHDVLCFQLVDRFADHGLVGTMIISYQGGEARILSWLLSCRVFSRTCEEFMLSKLVGRAQERSVDSIVGEYLATEKNKVVADLYARLGFVESDNNGIFVLKIANASMPRTFVSSKGKG